MLVELCFENQLLLTFEAHVSWVAIFEPQFYLFVFSVVALDIIFVNRLWILDIANIVVNHYVFWLLEAHCVVRLVMINRVFFFLIYTLVLKRKFLRVFCTEKFVNKDSFPTCVFVVRVINFIFCEEKFFSVLGDWVLDNHQDWIVELIALRQRILPELKRNERLLSLLDIKYEWPFLELNKLEPCFDHENPINSFETTHQCNLLCVPIDLLLFDF